MIEEDYVSFELAKMLKEKGFDEYCSHFYRLDGEHEYCYKAKLPRLTNNDIRNHDDWVNRVFACTCPTLQMALKWLRNEGFHIFIVIDVDYDEDERGEKWYHTPGYYTEIYRVCDGKIMYDDGSTYATPEQASEVAIKYCLENLI
jgi:hypothetical protein